MGNAYSRIISYERPPLELHGRGEADGGFRVRHDWGIAVTYLVVFGLPLLRFTLWRAVPGF